MNELREERPSNTNTMQIKFKYINGRTWGTFKYIQCSRDLTPLSSYIYKFTHCQRRANKKEVDLKEVSAQNQQRPLVTIAQQCLLCPSNLTDHGANFDEIFSLQRTLMDKQEISIEGWTKYELTEILFLTRINSHIFHLVHLNLAFARGNIVEVKKHN